MKRFIFAAILAVSSASAESRWIKAAKWTAAAVVATSAADAASSWGRLEAHPGLRGSDGRFGARGLTIKAAGTAAYLAVQAIRGRDPDKARQIALTNAAVAAIFGGAAVYNYRLARRPQPIIITVGETRLTWVSCGNITCGGFLP